MEYPKTENLLLRNEETHKLIYGAFRLPQFTQIREWLVTEKIDGTNIRVMLRWAIEDGEAKPIVFVRGRSDAANLPPNFVQETLGVEEPMSLMPEMLNAVMALTGRNWTDLKADPVDLTVFGEGYGAGIQKIGRQYNSHKRLRIFDVVTSKTLDGVESRGYWRPWSDVQVVASHLGLKTVPVISILDTGEIISMVQNGVWSRVKEDENPGEVLIAEGVVARTDPYLFDGYGHRVMFKLKGEDLPELAIV